MVSPIVPIPNDKATAPFTCVTTRSIRLRRLACSELSWRSRWLRHSASRLASRSLLTRTAAIVSWSPTADRPAWLREADSSATNASISLRSSASRTRCSFCGTRPLRSERSGHGHLPRASDATARRFPAITRPPPLPRGSSAAPVTILGGHGEPPRSPSSASNSSASSDAGPAPTRPPPAPTIDPPGSAPPASSTSVEPSHGVVENAIVTALPRLSRLCLCVKCVR